MQYLFNKKQFIIFLLSISFLAFAPKIVLAAEYDLIWSQVSNPSGGSDIPAGVAADSSGIYAVGHDMTLGVNNSQWRIEKRQITAYIDCGLRIRNGIQTIFIACEPAGTLTSPLRIRKGATTYGIPLVGTSDSSASAIRINTSSGIKALRKYP